METHASSQRLQGRVALITGSDSGIGQATAVEMAAEGADIIVHYRSDKEGAETTRQEVERLGRRALVVQADVGFEQDVERMFDEALQTFDHIDILVNNAGTGGDGNPTAQTTYEDFDKVIKADLYGPFLCSRRFINEHERTKAHCLARGKIITVTSVHDEIAMPGSAAYDAAKGGAQMLTRTFAVEIADQDISVSNIGPGMILTPMNQEAVDNEQARKEKEQNIPMKRAGEPWEIGRLAVYLASTDGDYVHGATFHIDGGLMQNVGQGA